MRSLLRTRRQASGHGLLLCECLSAVSLASVSEPFTRTTAASNKGEAISKFVDKMFDSAYNTSVVNADLPDVRWGRIDYFNVTYLTTKWNVWQYAS